MKTTLDKVYEINEFAREIDTLESKKRMLNKYIDYMNRNEIDHIGFDCSNTYHNISKDDDLNIKIVDLLMNHYKSEIKEIDYQLDLLIKQINDMLK